MIAAPLGCARRLAATASAARRCTARLPLLLIGPLLLVQTAQVATTAAAATTDTSPAAAAAKRPRTARRTQTPPAPPAANAISPDYTAQARPSCPPLPERLNSDYEPDFEMGPPLHTRRELAAEAWECSGMTNAELVQHLANNRIIKSQRVFDAMRDVDRGIFIPGRVNPIVAYQDAPQTLGFGATISAPHMHAMCLELLADKLQPGSRALDVGSGSGYLVAAMAHLVAGGKKAHEDTEIKTAENTPAAAAASSASSSAPSATPSVVGIEHIQELVEMSQGALHRWSADYASSIQVLQGDGRLGMAGHKFDAIHVGAAAERVPPALLEQLKPGGRLVIPVGGAAQSLLCIDKDEHGKLHQRTVTGVRYVPLTDEQKQRGSVW